MPFAWIEEFVHRQVPIFNRVCDRTVLDHPGRPPTRRCQNVTLPSGITVEGEPRSPILYWNPPVALGATLVGVATPTANSPSNQPLPRSVRGMVVHACGPHLLVQDPVL